MLTYSCIHIRVESPQKSIGNLLMTTIKENIYDLFSRKWNGWEHEKILPTYVTYQTHEYNSAFLCEPVCNREKIARSFCNQKSERPISILFGGNKRYRPRGRRCFIRNEFTLLFLFWFPFNK